MCAEKNKYWVTRIGVLLSRLFIFYDEMCELFTSDELIKSLLRIRALILKYFSRSSDLFKCFVLECRTLKSKTGRCFFHCLVHICFTNNHLTLIWKLKQWMKNKKTLKIQFYSMNRVGLHSNTCCLNLRTVTFCIEYSHHYFLFLPF